MTSLIHKKDDLGKIYSIPVQYEVGGYSKIRAKNKDEAIKKLEKKNVLPQDPEYVDGSFEILYEIVEND